MSTRICPVCGKSYSEPPALSRSDNKTEICPDCGMLEALQAMEDYCSKEASARRTVITDNT